MLTNPAVGSFMGSFQLSLCLFVSACFPRGVHIHTSKAHTWLLPSIFYPRKSLTSVRTETITKVTTKNVPSIFRWLKAVFIFSNPPPHRKRPNLSHWRSVISLRERAESAHRRVRIEQHFPTGGWRVEKRMLVASAHTHSGRYIINTFFLPCAYFSRQSRPGMDIYLWVEQNRVYGPCLLNAKCVLPTCALERLLLFYLSRCALAGHCCSVCTLSGPQVKLTEENSEECDHSE